jgi:hypothetical protein
MSADTVQTMGADWADQVGAVGFHDYPWAYLKAEGTCSACGQTIRVGACSVTVGREVRHVRCVDWQALPCSVEGAASVRRDWLKSTKAKGDHAAAPRSWTSVAKAIAKLDPREAPRFRLVPPAVSRAEDRVVVLELHAYNARAAVASDQSVEPVAAGHATRPKRVRAPKVAPVAPQVVCEAPVQADEVPEPADVAAWCTSWAAWAQRWADCVAIGAELRASARAQAIDDDPDVYTLPDLVTARAVLWDRVAAGRLAIDAAMAHLERLYAAEAVGR